ncbi:ribosomal pseudouridine synthase-like protein [Leptotrombidium deliense]|uniref:Pseudouridylate synthase RPUSD4, mitochondrial n=1 Tax=Leptotrombidium deliense TaxID=299467 RepID=A0A443SPX6_9ACAR|nr:ribosomal pseudouridine synthase-like protein [Leptotrombidium deliense]
MNRVFFLHSKFHLFFIGKRNISKQFSLRCQHRQNQVSTDVFGIEDIQKEDVTGVFTLTSEQKLKYPKIAQQILKDPVPDLKEKIFVTSYGAIRFDSQNQARVHGQFDDDFDEDKFISDSAAANAELNFIDEQYFLNDNVTYVKKNHESDWKELGSGTETNESVQSNNDSKLSEQFEDTNFIDQQYFYNNTITKTTSSCENDTVSDNETNTTTSRNLSDVLVDANFVDKQYFLNETTTDVCSTKETDVCEPVPEDNISSKSKYKQNYQMAKFNFNITEQWQAFVGKKYNDLETAFGENDDSVLAAVHFAKSSPLKHVEEIGFELSSDDIDNNEGEISTVGQEVKELEAQSSKIEEVPDPQNAFEYYQHLKRGIIEPETEQLKKEFATMRSNKEAASGSVSLDSQGFRTFKEQTIDYTKMRKEEIVWMLKKNVLFNDCDILAINKPYGIVCHGNKLTADSPLLHELLPDFANLLKVEQLYPVHRLDQDATGVLLLAKTQQMASLLTSMFKNRKIKKYYTVITRGVPDNKEGVIDIPMEKVIFKGKERMCLRPDIEREYQKMVKPSTHAKRAVTHYKVKKESGNSALLEVYTETGVRHQIRCHLGFGLRTPILGDHKYSYLDKLAPQKLPSSMLTRLNVRQTKVRNIPLHLHCRLVIVPEVGRNGTSISIAAHLPSAFKKNAAALNLL